MYVSIGNCSYRLENEVDCLEADRSSVAYVAQIEALEKSLAQVSYTYLENFISTSGCKAEGP